MFKTILIVLTLMLTLANAQTVPFVLGESLPAGEQTVDRAIDGDGIQITVNGVSRSIRFIGIDARERGQPYYAEAKQFVADLLTGQTVTITPGVQPVDHFGRALGYLSLDGKDVALQVAQAGLADEMTLKPNDQFAPLYKAAVNGAKSVGKGIHADARPARRKYKCSSFSTQAEAQAFAGGAALPGKPDPHNLDRDNDTRACQSLPIGRPLSFLSAGL